MFFVHTNNTNAYIHINHTTANFISNPKDADRKIVLDYLGFARTFCKTFYVVSGIISKIKDAFS
jgi:hypothetical protein